MFKASLLSQLQYNKTLQEYSQDSLQQKTPLVTLYVIYYFLNIHVSEFFKGYKTVFGSKLLKSGVKHHRVGKPFHW